MSDQGQPGRPRRQALVVLLVLFVGAVAVVFVLPDRQSHRSGSLGRASTTPSPPTLSPPTPSPTTLSPPTRPAGAHRVPAPSQPARAPAAPPRTVSDPGALPQTTAFPPSTGAPFAGEMAALWQGVLAGSLRPARPAFFPESAYVQVKAISDPAADYVDRLLGEFSADLVAAHALLGPGADRARLLTVVVPSQYGHWVPPGACANRVGYFEVPNSRLVYRDGEGQTRSFGVASMISWRGTWYVVHLGAVVRSSRGGIVDDPEPGWGTPAYSSTC